MYASPPSVRQPVVQGLDVSKALESDSLLHLKPPHPGSPEEGLHPPPATAGQVASCALLLSPCPFGRGGESNPRLVQEGRSLAHVPFQRCLWGCFFLRFRRMSDKLQRGSFPFGTLMNLTMRRDSVKHKALRWFARCCMYMGQQRERERQRENTHATTIINSNNI